MSAEESGSLPRVGLFHGRLSAHPLVLASAASGLCEILWLVDSNEPGIDHDIRLLKKLGPVVDVAGLSLDQVAESMRSHDPAGLAAFYDEKLMTTALLGLMLDLPFFTPEVAENLVNKLSQRRALMAGGVPCPKFWDLPADVTEQELSILADEVIYPSVLKPQLGTGSQGTHLLKDADALIEAWRIEHDHDHGHAAAMIVEEFIVGTPGEPGDLIVPYVSVESVVSQGAVSHLALTGRFPVADGFRETGFFIPRALPPEERAEVLDTAGRAARALGITRGFVNVEMKLTQEGPRVIEINGRPGGGTSTVLELASGLALLPLVFRQALGEHIVFDDMIPTTNIGYLFYRQPPEGATIVSAIDGLEQMRTHPGVTSINLRRKAGDDVDARIGITGYVYSVEGVAENERQLTQAYRVAQNDVRVTFNGIEGPKQ
jgi:biotin carboxylase